jgi:manganese-dependent inorganic pyrophosphatase
METIYIAGHKSPDLDSVMGSISYAYLKSQVDTKHKFQPVITGELNLETKYILDKYDLAPPDQMDSLSGKSVILVDHNEAYQAIDGLAEAEILEIIDHHKMSFDYHAPIKIIVEPIGSSCSVIFKMFKAEQVDIPQNIAAGMLAAVLTDTVITKSPTTTRQDREIIPQLSDIAGIDDWHEYGMEIFKVRSSVSDKTDEEIIVSDYKDFEIGGSKFGIGQVETVDITEFDDRKQDLLDALQSKRSHENYHTIILFITDILAEESTFLIASTDEDKVARAFGTTCKDHQFIAPVMSRKKQVVPSLMKEFKETK